MPRHAYHIFFMQVAVGSMSRYALPNAAASKGNPPNAVTCSSQCRGMHGDLEIGSRLNAVTYSSQCRGMLVDFGQD